MNAYQKPYPPDTGSSLECGMVRCLATTRARATQYAGLLGTGTRIFLTLKRKLRSVMRARDYTAAGPVQSRFYWNPTARKMPGLWASG